MLCVLMVEGMSVVVNVMLFLMSVMSLPPVLCNLSARTVVKLCTLGVCFTGELGFLNCDDICMCVVNKQFELREFVFLIPFMLNCSVMRFLSLLLLFTAVSVSLCCVCSPLWTVCEVVVVHYVDAVVAVTVMCVPLFVVHVCMLREREGDENAGVGDR